MTPQGCDAAGCGDGPVPMREDVPLGVPIDTEQTGIVAGLDKAFY